ncbi:hypothetical protein [Paenibacillus brevis]|uniref:Uncharacterized protein n=1 Tax=Paenibacillus brevis TaxID=2841508 RepID=A0ABS6FJU8_9BACL|nr:hypothetical protein [Paenibacillus brevis]MBU5670241.1 hypothetical protein [Paenibacillus brevis]
MSKITNVIKIEMMPTVPELLSVASAVAAFYPGREKEIMQAIRDAAERRIEELNKQEESAK